MLIVQKYGGSSLATPRHIQRAAQRIQGVRSTGRDLVVVASAMGRTTDHLMKLALRTVINPAPRELDMLLTTGERVSMALLSMALQELGIPAISFTGSQSGIVTSPHHTDAKILEVRCHRIREELAKRKVVIIAGFQGVSEQKEITTLGRGGSDTTAVAIAASLRAETCEILTDVNGLFTADPRIVPTARLLPSCSYDVALELASLGAKMQARSIELAKKFHVKVRIASSFYPDARGTLLIDSKTRGITVEKSSITGIATKEGYHLFKVEMPLDSLTEILGENHVPIRFFNYSNNHVTFLCERDRVPRVRALMSVHSGEYEEIEKISIVSAVGEGLSNDSGILPMVLKVLRSSGAQCLLLCSNAMSITLAVESRFKDELTIRLHEALVEKPGEVGMANGSAESFAEPDLLPI